MMPRCGADTVRLDAWLIALRVTLVDHSSCPNSISTSNSWGCNNNIHIYIHTHTHQRLSAISVLGEVAGVIELGGDVLWHGLVNEDLTVGHFAADAHDPITLQTRVLQLVSRALIEALLGSVNAVLSHVAVALEGGHHLLQDNSAPKAAVYGSPVQDHRIFNVITAITHHGR